MKTAHRPALREPVRSFIAKLNERRDEIPLAEFAALFGAGEDVIEKVRPRGAIVFKAALK